MSDQPSHPLPADMQLVVVPHVHADLSWPDIPDVCINACVNAIGDTLRFLQRTDDFRFTMEHMFYLRTYLSRFPEHKEVIRDLIERKIFECGAMFLGSTEVTTGAEGLVRCLTLGAGWLKRTLGVQARMAWNVDCPGHTLQLPQILAKAGVQHFVVYKKFDYYERDFSGYSGPWLFRWRAPDGSAVTVAYTPGGYHVAEPVGLRRDVDAMRERLPAFLQEVNEHFRQYGLPPVVLLADGGDIQRPSLKVLENIKAWNARGEKPALVIGSTSEFFERLAGSTLPETQGEMPSWWDTMQGHQQRMIMADRRSEAKLLAAESLGAFLQKVDATWEYPASNIETAWQNRLWVTEHNWDGRNGDISDALLLNKAQSADVLARNSLDQAFIHLSANIAPKQEGIPVIVYNALAWARREVATVALRFAKGAVFALSASGYSGNPLPLQPTRMKTYNDGSLQEVELLLQVEVGPYGYTTCYLHPVDAWPTTDTYTVTDYDGKRVESSDFRLVVDAASGGLVSLWDKRQGREWVNASKFHLGELIAFEETGADETEYLTGRYWLGRDFATKVYLAENGPVRAVIVAEGPFLSGACRKQSFILYRDLPRLEVHTVLDWDGEAARRINVLFPFAQSPSAQLTYEVPFGAVRFGEESPFHTKIHPSLRFARNWLDISDGERGVTLTTEVVPNDVRDRTPSPLPGFLIQPILLRTVYSCYEYIDIVRKYNLIGERFGLRPLVKQFDMAPEAPQTYFRQVGRHNYRFAIHPHVGALEPQAATRRGLEHNTPLFAFVWQREQLWPLSHLDRHHARLLLERTEPLLPPERSLLQVTSEEERVVVSAVKPADNGQGLVVRLFNTGGTAAAVVLTTAWPLAQAWQTNLLEENQTSLTVSGEQCRLTVGPYAIETVRLILK